MPTSIDDNQPETVTDMASIEGKLSSHRNTMRKNMKTFIPITFKGNVPEAGAVIVTKDENYKKSFQNLQKNVLQYIVVN